MDINAFNFEMKKYLQNLTTPPNPEIQFTYDKVEIKHFLEQHEKTNLDERQLVDKAYKQQLVWGP